MMIFNTNTHTRKPGKWWALVSNNNTTAANGTTRRPSGQFELTINARGPVGGQANWSGLLVARILFLMCNSLEALLESCSELWRPNSRELGGRPHICIFTKKASCYPLVVH